MLQFGIGSIYPYPSGLFHWHWGNHESQKHPWRIWVDASCGSAGNLSYNHKTKHNNAMQIHRYDVIMSAMASQITSHTIVYSTIHSGADQRRTSKLRVTGLLLGIHRWPMNSLRKGPVTCKLFPYDDVIMLMDILLQLSKCWDMLKGGQNEITEESEFWWKTHQWHGPLISWMHGL